MRSCRPYVVLPRIERRLNKSRLFRIAMDKGDYAPAPDVSVAVSAGAPADCVLLSMVTL